MKYCLYLWFCLLPSALLAASPTPLRVAAQESALTFTAHYNHSPVTGSFSDIGGDIAFAPDALEQSHARIEIGMKSLASADKDAAENLPAKPWFASAEFPVAVFESKTFRHVGGKDYEAQGTLALRGKTVPIALHFTLLEYDAAKGRAKAKGAATLKRRDFGVGEGEWAGTKTVADEVTVHFTVVATQP